MLLGELLKRIDYIECMNYEDCEILGVSSHSASVSNGFVFVIVKGRSTDGACYTADAEKLGACAFVTESKDKGLKLKNAIIVENARKCKAEISKVLYGENVDKLKIIGITGTKGKTTTARFLAECISSLGQKCVSIGTLGVEYYEGRGRVLLSGKSENTTPDSPFIFKTLADAYSDGVRVAIIEVSSQGLKDHRVFGIPFTVCVFTNFSPDHVGISEHSTVKEYLDCKRTLFCNYGCKICIVNSDDESASFISQGIDHVIRVGKDSEAFKLSVLASDGAHSSFTINGYPFTVSIGGDFNAYNAACAVVTASLIFGRDPRELADAIKNVSVPGRYELYRLKDVSVIIDFAHNGESFRSILSSVRKSAKGKIISLFGSVGERSLQRRAELAIVAEELSDFIVLTADDPARESALDICEEIMGYMVDVSHVKIVPDREKAIRFALDIASGGDTVLLLGKGHEEFQLIGESKIPFSERKIIESLGAVRVF